MDRRGFLRTLVGGLAAVTAERVFPFRVYSFPTRVASPTLDILNPAMEEFARAIPDAFYVDTPFLTYLRAHAALGASRPDMQMRITNIIAPSDDDIAVYANG